MLSHCLQIGHIFSSQVLIRNPDNRKPSSCPFTYGSCCLLEFWVPSLASIRAKQPRLLNTISETGRQQDWSGRRRQPRGKRKRLLLTIYSELALIIKTTELPHAEAPPSHFASSLICNVIGSSVGMKEKQAGYEQKPIGRNKPQSSFAGFQFHFKVDFVTQWGLQQIMV